MHIPPKCVYDVCMTTAPITRALRKSNLVEYKILERNNRQRIIKAQEGWQLTKHDDHVVVSHTGMNSFNNYEFKTDERTTDNYEAFAAWLDEVLLVLRAAGLEVEVVTGEYKWGSFKQYSAQIVKQVVVK